MKKLLYISAGGSALGIGHLRRSAQVIGILSGSRTDLLSVALIPNDSDAVKLEDFLRPYNKRVSSLEEIETEQASGVVVDVDDDLQPEMLNWLKLHNLKAFALDWYIKDDGVVKDKINLREGVVAFKYSIIRKEFHGAKQRQAGNPPSYDAVVVLGGGDFRRYIPKLLSFFNKDNFFSDRKIVVVLGPMIDEQKLGIDNQPKNILILKNPENLAELMVNAYIGISNGGTSLMEFAMLGVPTLVLPESSKEDAFIIPFIENGSSKVYSPERRMFKLQLKELWDNPMLRKQMSEKAQQLIDGFGAQRIADRINMLYGG